MPKRSSVTEEGEISHASQRRRLELAEQRRVVSRMLAGAASVIAPTAITSKRAVSPELQAHLPSRVRSAVLPTCREAQIVECVVGQPRSPVALHAAASHERQQPIFALGVERILVAPEVGIQRVGGNAQTAFPCRDRLAHVHEDLGHGVAISRAHRFVGSFLRFARRRPSGRVDLGEFAGRPEPPRFATPFARRTSRSSAQRSCVGR